MTDVGSKKYRFIMCGATGRMGRKIMEIALNDGHEIVGAICGPTDPEARHSIEQLLPTVKSAPSEVRCVTQFDDMTDACFKDADFMIDFSYAGFSVEVAKACHKHQLCLVQGTTGLAPEQEKEILDMTNDGLRILRADNFSLGVNLLRKYAKELARALPSSYNIECVEYHHNLKRDAPSGTANFLVEACREGRDLPKDALIYGRSGMVGERPENEIGVHAVRGGSIVGDHEVSFINNHEMISISHRALDRDLFAAGAVNAAIWMAVNSKAEGGLFNMDHVLGIE